MVCDYGFTINRDQNAAINILNEGLRLLNKIYSRYGINLNFIRLWKLCKTLSYVPSQPTQQWLKQEAPTYRSQSLPCKHIDFRCKFITFEYAIIQKTYSFALPLECRQNIVMIIVKVAMLFVRWHEKLCCAWSRIKFQDIKAFTRVLRPHRGYKMSSGWELKNPTTSRYSIEYCD